MRRAHEAILSFSFFHWFFTREKKASSERIGYEGRAPCCEFLCMCVIQHFFAARFNTIALDAHVTKSSPPGLCARKQTEDTFTNWCGGKSLTVGRASCGNVYRFMSLLNRNVFFVPANSRQTVPVHSRHTVACPQQADYACPQPADYACPQQVDCLSTAGSLSLSAAIHSRQTGPIRSRQRRL